MDANPGVGGKTAADMAKWPSTFIKLVALELFLSVIFIAIGYLSGNEYFRGVGIGLLIAWVTGAVAYFVVSRRK